MPIVKRAVNINGHKTSVSLEPDFWDSLKEIAKERQTTIRELIGTVDKARTGSDPASLASSLRVFVLNFYLQKSAAKNANDAAEHSGNGADRSTQ